MKNRVCGIVLLAALLVSVGCQSAGPRGAVVAGDDQPIKTDTATLHVKGMSCPLCASGIDKQLRRLPGVSRVTSDLGSGKVKVTLVGEQRPTARQLSQAVEDSGFTLDRIEKP